MDLTFYLPIFNSFVFIVLFITVPPGDPIGQLITTNNLVLNFAMMIDTKDIRRSLMQYLVTSCFLHSYAVG